MSYYTKQLKDFALRLKADGYPTAVVERAAERMDQLEEEVVRLHKQSQTLEKIKDILDPE